MELNEFDRPSPENPYFLNEEERFGLLFALHAHVEKRQLFTRRTWLQEFEFLMKFIAAPSFELRPAMRNHLRLMIAHAAQCVTEEYSHAAEDYAYTKDRIYHVVLEDLQGSGIMSLDDLRSSDAWRNAYVDLIAFNNQSSAGDE